MCVSTSPRRIESFEAFEVSEMKLNETNLTQSLSNAKNLAIEKLTLAEKGI